MNEPTIDNLFSVVVPRPDVSLSVGARRSDDPGGFDDQLRQAGYSEPTPPPWRPPTHSNDANQRRPDANATSSSPPPPRPQPAPKPAAAQSPATDTNSGADNSPVVNKASKKYDRDKHDSDQSAANAGTATNTAQVANKSASDKSSSDKSGPDKPGTGIDPASEVARGTKASTDQADQAKLGNSATTQAASTETVKPAAATAKDDSAAVTTQDTSVPQPEVTVATNDQAKPAPPADIKTDSPKAEVAAKLTEPATPNSASAAIAAVVTNEQAATTTDTPVPDAKSQSGKTASDRGASAQQTSKQSIGEIEQPAAKQLAAGQAASASSNPVDASTQPAAASASTPTARPDAKQKDQTSVADPSSAAPPNPTDVTRTNPNQSTPNVAAITTPNAVATASQVDGAAGDAKVTKTAATLKSTGLSAFGRFDRDGSLTPLGPRQASESQDAPSIDPTRFVSRVARAIETAQERGGPINLRLSPPELGSLRIELSLKDGVMNVKVETETASARQALLDNLPALRDKLANQNVRIERFDVDVRRDAQGDQSNSGPQQRQFQQQQQQYYQSRSARPATAATGGIEGLAPEPTSAIRTITDTTINLVA